MKVLGIDPGYAIVGYGLIEAVNGRLRPLEYGAIRTKPDQPFEQRLLQIDRALAKILDTWHPAVMGVEELFFARNTTTAMGTAQARGVILCAAARAGVPVFEYTPMQVKLAVTGYGRADKQQVQDMVRRLLNLREVPRPDDVADALGVAICQAHTGPNKDFRAVSGYNRGLRVPQSDKKRE